MGFSLNRTYVLKFEGAMAGAEIKIRSTTAGTVMEIREASGVSDANRLSELLADHLISWNLDDRAGKPLALEAKAILAELEEPVIDAILLEWYRAATGVTAPLDAPSTSGEQFPEESIPMETS